MSMWILYKSDNSQLFGRLKSELERHTFWDNDIIPIKLILLDYPTVPISAKYFGFLRAR